MMLDMISVFLNLLRLVVCPCTWSTQEYIPYILKENVYTGLFIFGSVLSISIKSGLLTVSFRACIVLLILPELSVHWYLWGLKISYDYCSIAQSCLNLCNSMDCSTPSLPDLHHHPEFAQTHVHWVDDAIKHLIICSYLLLLPSIFPSIRVSSSESALCIRWPKYWSFSISISPSN